MAGKKTVDEPERYRRDVPQAGVYVLDAGHFALDTKADEIAALVREFRRLGRSDRMNEGPLVTWCG